MNPLKFKEKCNVLYRIMCWGSAGQQYGQKGAGGPDAQLFNMSQGALAARKANGTLGCIRLQRRWSAPLFSIGETTVVVLCQFWASLYKRDTGVQKRLQLRDARVVKGLGYCICEGRLRELGPLLLEKRRLRRDLIYLCKYLKGGCNLCEYLKGGCFQWFPVARTRGTN